MADAIVREVWIGPHRLIQDDCMEVLPLLSGVDVDITDPPYGVTEAYAQVDLFIPAPLPAPVQESLL